jgi:hypothetical protein
MTIKVADTKEARTKAIENSINQIRTSTKEAAMLFANKQFVYQISELTTAANPDTVKKMITGENMNGVDPDDTYPHQLYTVEEAARLQKEEIIAWMRKINQ